MIAPLTKLLDWSAVQAVTLMMPPDCMQRPRLEEALEFLKGPEFIPNESQPAQVEFDPGKSGMHFRFPSPRPGNCSENNMVYGRFYRCGERWQERPVVILLHGSGDSLNYNFRFPLIARRCNRAGFNAAALVAPYHFQRRPRQLGGSLGYSDCLQFAEATAQAIAEIRALSGWLLGKGCPAVALWGYSMGAWYAGMAACRDARLAAVVLGATCARMNPWAEQRAVRPRVRARLPLVRGLCDGLNLTAMNLLTAQPVIPKKQILLLEASYDSMICPKEDTEDLWRAWEKPDIWRLPHGHVGVCCGFVPGLPERVLRWLTPRLGSRKTVISGMPDRENISTSHTERQNLTMRMSMRRFTRLTNGFSKKVESHEHALALYFMYYNFARVHQTLRVTPAMEAGIADHVWTLEEIVCLIK